MNSQCLQYLLGYIANVHVRVIPGPHDQVYSVCLGVNPLVCVTFPYLETFRTATILAKFPAGSLSIKF